MSKIGKIPIELPEQVSVATKGRQVVVSGPKGELSLEVPAGIKVEKQGSLLLVKRERKEEETKALQGTARQNLANLVKGVSEGFGKTLEVVGTGYRVSLQGDKLVLSLGFSHPVEVPCPPGIKFAVIESKIKVSGIDKVQVGQVAANLRKIRPPDAYKGKGIRYEGEFIKLKPGKAAKVGTGTPGQG